MLLGPASVHTRDGRADVLCTLDRDFHQPHMIKFCRARDIAVMTSVDFLRLLVSSSTKDR
jgi:hypothetical protein